jgi:hypothetical protein
MPGSRPIEGTYDLAEMRAKWRTYSELLGQPEGDGSLLGRLYIIARTAVTDIDELLDLLEGALESSDD